MRGLKHLSYFLTKFTALVIILTAAFTFFVPETFTWVKGDAQIIVLGIIMLGMGMTLGKQDYQILVQRPLDIFVGAVAQYTIMPFIAITIANVF